MLINIEEYRISDDWGWFVDTENQKPIEKIVKYNKNKLNRIDDNDEYEYYINNKKSICNIDYLINDDKLKTTCRTCSSKNMECLIEVCSKTIFGILLTYMIYIIL
jgi:hypothetical protein